MKKLIVILSLIAGLQKPATTHADAVGAPTGATLWCEPTPNPQACQATINSFHDDPTLKGTPEGAVTILLRAATDTIQPAVALLTEESSKPETPEYVLVWLDVCKQGVINSADTLTEIDSDDLFDQQGRDEASAELKTAATTLIDSCPAVVPQPGSNFPPEVQQHIADLVGIICNSANAASIILAKFTS